MRYKEILITTNPQPKLYYKHCNNNSKLIYYVIVICQTEWRRKVSTFGREIEAEEIFLERTKAGNAANAAKGITFPSPDPSR